MPKSREKGHGVKGSGPPLREIAISAGMGSAVVLALLTVFALVMSAQDIPGGLTAPMVTITLVVGTLAARLPLRPAVATEWHRERSTDRRNDVPGAAGNFPNSSEK